MQAATDSESRKRILFMILAPVLGLLLLIAFIPVSYTHLDVYKRQQQNDSDYGV